MGEEFYNCVIEIDVKDFKSEKLTITEGKITATCEHLSNVATFFKKKEYVF